MIVFPMVSAVIPTYNSEKVLPLCLESIKVVGLKGRII